MPGTIARTPSTIRRRVASATLLTLALAAACPALPASAGPIGNQIQQWSAYWKARRQIGSETPRPEGPIAASFQQWSAGRQAKTQVEKPFSRQSSAVNLNGPSPLQKLRSRLTGKSGDVANTHQVKVEYMKHERGVLQH